MATISLFAILLLISSLKAEEECLYENDEKNSIIFIQCPKNLYGSSGFTIRINSKLIKINCISLKTFSTKLKNLKKIKILRQPEYLQLQNCPLPDEGFANLMFWLGVNKTKILEFWGPASFPELTDELKELQLLEKLSLKATRIKNLGYLPKLNTLEIRKSILELNSKLFKNLPSLISLDISANGISEIPKGTFENCQNLKELSLNGNSLSNLSNSSLVGLSSLRELRLSYNQLEGIDSNAFKNLSKLAIIALSDNKLATIPPNLFDFNPNLQTLILSGNKFVSFSKFSKKLLQLGLLDLSACRLQSLDDNLLENLPNLKTIFLSKNFLATFSTEFFQFAKNLEEIFLSQNFIEDIGNSFQFLPHLKILSLDNNTIKSLNKNHFAGSIKLEKIDFSSNNMSFISKETFWPTIDLKSIDLSDNKLDNKALQIITEIGPKLVQIDFSNNNVRYINFSLLQNLGNGFQPIQLNLAYNAIERVDLTNLEFIGTRDISINLNFNSISCNCWNFGFFQFLKTHNRSQKLHFINFEKINCALLDLGEVKCAISENFGCPNECASCDWIPFQKSVVFDCSHQNLKYYPIINTSLINYPFNSTIVHLENNNLTEGPSDIQDFFNITELYLSNNQIDEISWLPAKLKVLHLHNNTLNNLNSSILQTLEELPILNLTLHGNPWFCDCKAEPLLNFIRNFSQKVDATDIKCINNKHLINLTKSDLCILNSIIIYSSIGFLIFVLLSSFIIIFNILLKKRLKIWLFAHGWCINLIAEEEMDDDRPYDVFISYSSKDGAFVEEKLFPWLEGSNYKVNIHFRDWTPGEFIINQIAESVESSKRTLIVLSPNFVDSCWGTYEFQMAYTEAIQENKRRIIVVLYKDTNLDNLEKCLKFYLKNTACLRWGGKNFWNELIFALPHKMSKKENSSS